MRLLNLSLDEFYLNVSIETTLTKRGFQDSHVLVLGDKLIGIPNKVVFDSLEGGFSISDEVDFSSSCFRLDTSGQYPIISDSKRHTYSGKNILFTGVSTNNQGFDLTSEVNLLLTNLSDINKVTLLAGGIVEGENGSSRINLVMSLPVSFKYSVDDVIFSALTGGVDNRSIKKHKVSVGSLLHDV